ncbi:glycosyltransferase family 2 protein [Riemerella anatipestifer]|uniref:glycosyltransferase family 2 protein n=1 Tax=Riemerella anatipestifer TaxID=34085 RepID=UPI002265A442|nr:glycosyltransferase [Riemerella anatipestifer]UZX28344.1 glycosyltransferase [Riemerella anatipestifer]
MNDSLILSIVIPTKNRYATLIPVLNYIFSSLKGANYEVVVHDNSDDNQIILDYISKMNEKRLKYFFSTDILSQTENSNQAILKSEGKYVCFIGDDDAVMPYILDVVKWMDSLKIDVLKGNKLQYFWPNQRYNYLSKSANGVLKIEAFNYQVREISSVEALNYTLKHGGVSMKKLPCVYHGVVSRKILNLIHQKTNTFFPGPSPDMANAISLTMVIDKYYYLDLPIVISGKSTHSIGGKGVLHKHISAISEVKHLPLGTNEKWTDRIPKYWTGPTIWAESVIKSLEALDKPELIKKMNYQYLYAHLYVFNYQHRRKIFKNFQFNFSFSFYYYFIHIFVYRVRTFIKNRVGLVYRIMFNIKDLKSASKAILSYVDLNKTVF